MVENGVEYRDIESFPGYLVGDDGSVWSTRKSHVGKGRVLKGRKVGSPDHHPIAGRYLAVALYRDGERVDMRVHSLVLTVFGGPRPTGQECCHVDGNPENNSLLNLRWGTHAENMADMKRQGNARSPRGVDNAKSKLSDAKVLEIYTAHATGESHPSIGKRYGVSKACIWSIVKGETWRHVMQVWRAEQAA